MLNRVSKSRCFVADPTTVSPARSLVHGLRRPHYVRHSVTSLRTRFWAEMKVLTSYQIFTSGLGQAWLYVDMVWCEILKNIYEKKIFSP